MKDSLWHTNTRMEISFASAALSFIFVTTLICAWRVLNWVWLRPKKLEKRLRQQGLTGNPYRLLVGDLKESAKMIEEASSRPLNLSDDIAQRVVPLFSQTMKNYGKSL